MGNTKQRPRLLLTGSKQYTTVVVEAALQLEEWAWRLGQTQLRQRRLGRAQPWQLDQTQLRRRRLDWVQPWRLGQTQLRRWRLGRAQPWQQGQTQLRRRRVFAARSSSLSCGS